MTRTQSRTPSQTGTQTRSANALAELKSNANAQSIPDAHFESNQHRNAEFILDCEHDEYADRKLDDHGESDWLFNRQPDHLTER